MSVLTPSRAGEPLVDMLQPLDPLHPLSRGCVAAFCPRAGMVGGRRLIDLVNPGPHGNHGTLTGMDPATDWAFAPELGRWALDLDGVGDYVHCGTHASLLPDAFTVAAFVKPNDVADNSLFAFVVGSPYVPRFAMHHVTTGKPIFYMGVSNYQYFSSGAWTTLKDGRWHSIAVTLPGAGQLDIEGSQCFIDGIADTKPSAPTTAGAQASKSAFTFGHSTYEMSGQVTDVLLYSRVLLPSEIALLANRSDPTYGGWIRTVGRRYWPASAPAGGATIRWPWQQRRRRRMAAGV